MIDALAAPVLAAASLGFMVLFAGSTRHKIHHWQVFRFVVDDYRVLPASLGAIASGAAVAAEVALLIGWALVFAQSFSVMVVAADLIPIVAGTTAALMSVYALAMLSLLLRGRVHVDCGCSSTDVPVSYRLIVRNFVLAGVAVLVAASPGVVVDVAALVIGFAGALIATLVYATFNQLARNAAEQSNWLVTNP